MVSDTAASWPRPLSRLRGKIKYRPGLSLLSYCPSASRSRRFQRTVEGILGLSLQHAELPARAGKTGLSTAPGGSRRGQRADARPNSTNSAEDMSAGSQRRPLRHRARPGLTILSFGLADDHEM